MRWDDELESLVNHVAEQFGETELDAALTRALEQTMKQMEPLSPGTPLMSFAGGISNGVNVVPPGVFEEAIRAELRSLTRPH